MNGKIYSIRSYETDDIYIGSTKQQKLCKRMDNHRRNYKFYLKNGRKYMTSCEMLKYNDAYIELIEEVKNCTKDELRKLEGQYIRENENCVNKRIEGRTKNDYRRDNKEKINKQRKGHYNENKTELLEEKKIYYAENKDKIKKQRSTKYLCECGKELTYGCKARHNKICPNNSKAI